MYKNWIRSVRMDLAGPQLHRLGRPDPSALGNQDTVANRWGKAELERWQKARVYAVNVSRCKLSCKVQKHHKVSYEDISLKTKYFFFLLCNHHLSSRSCKKFLQISLFIKIDAFKPTSKRFGALWQGTCFKNFFFCLFVR